MGSDAARPPEKPPFGLGEIDHVVLRARDAGALADFYVGALGCTRERVEGTLTQLRAGRSLIDIVPSGAGEGRGCNVDHICLTLEPFDADAITEWFAARGIATGEAAMRYGAGGTGLSIYVTDPEGNGLELKAAAN